MLLSQKNYQEHCASCLPFKEGIHGILNQKLFPETKYEGRRTMVRKVMDQLKRQARGY